MTWLLLVRFCGSSSTSPLGLLRRNADPFKLGVDRDDRAGKDEESLTGVVTEGAVKGEESSWPRLEVTT